MALTATEVRSFGFGHVYVAPVGTDIPDTPTEALDADWADLGHVSDAGVTPNWGKAKSGVSSWQSFPDYVRMLDGVAPKSLAFALLQWNSSTLAYAFGDGGEFTEPTTGVYSYQPGEKGASDDERAILLEAVDGDYTYRLGYRRSLNQANLSVPFVGSALAPLNIDAVCLEPDGGEDAWFFITDDPAFAPLGS